MPLRPIRIVHAVPTRQVEEHARGHHLGVPKALVPGPNRQVPVGRLRQPQHLRQIREGREPARSRVTGIATARGVRERGHALGHDGTTS